MLLSKDSDWLFITQPRELQADWMLLDNNGKTALHISIPLFWDIIDIEMQQQSLTSTPSLLIIVLSILRIAALIVRAGGSLVRPMLMALDRFESNTVINFLFPSVCFWNQPHWQ